MRGFAPQAAGGVCEVTADEVEEGETDKLMRRILLSAHEVGILCCFEASLEKPRETKVSNTTDASVCPPVVLPTRPLAMLPVGSDLSPMESLHHFVATWHRRA